MPANLNGISLIGQIQRELFTRISHRNLKYLHTSQLYTILFSKAMLNHSIPQASLNKKAGQARLHYTQ
jgi:hypothetical protein